MIITKDMLNQKVYKQKLLNLNKIPIIKEINGVKFADSLSVLNDVNELIIVRENILN